MKTNIAVKVHNTNQDYHVIKQFRRLGAQCHPDEDLYTPPSDVITRFAGYPIYRMIDSDGMIRSEYHRRVPSEYLVGNYKIIAIHHLNAIVYRHGMRINSIKKLAKEKEYIQKYSKGEITKQELEERGVNLATPLKNNTMKSFKNKYVTAPNKEIERLVLERLIRLGYDLGMESVDDFIYNHVTVDHPVYILINEGEGDEIDAFYDIEYVIGYSYKKVSLEEFFSTEWGETKDNKTIEVKEEKNDYSSVSFKELDRTIEIRYDGTPMLTGMFAGALIDLVKGSGFHEPDVFEKLQHLIEEELDGN